MSLKVSRFVGEPICISIIYLQNTAEQEQSCGVDAVTTTFFLPQLLSKATKGVRNDFSVLDRGA
jgi:hypothetical protein